MTHKKEKGGVAGKPVGLGLSGGSLWASAKVCGSCWCSATALQLTFRHWLQTLLAERAAGTCDLCWNNFGSALLVPFHLNICIVLDQGGKYILSSGTIFPQLLIFL